MNKDYKNKSCNILLTDIQIHATKPRKPTSQYRAILKSLKNKKPGRFYTKNFDGKKAIFDLPPKIKREMEKAEKSGKKIRLFMPKEGLPIFVGKDLKEKLEAKNRKKKA